MLKLSSYETGNTVSFDFLDLSGRKSYYKQGYKGQSVIVAVVDTGVSEHDELQGKVLPGVNFCSMYPDDERYYNDDNGHGAHVAGTIAGTNCGIAPEAKILPVKVLAGDGTGMIPDLIAALNWIRDWRSDDGQKVDIVSISLSCPESDYTYQLRWSIRELVDSGIAVIVASGNSGDSTVQYPSFFSEPIVVGAVDSKLQTALFSTRSNEVDVCQVGVNVVSCDYQGGYIAFSGTSMATPIVSGIAALIVSKYKALYRDYMPEMVLYHMLKMSTIDIEAPGVDAETGAGFCTLAKQLPQELRLKLGEKYIEKDGAKHDIDVAPFAQNDRTFTPTRHTHEAFGDKVEWLPETQEVIIKRF